MTWQRFEHRPSGEAEIWFRFLGGSAGDWERPNGQRFKSLNEAEKMGWMRIGPSPAPGMPEESEGHQVALLKSLKMARDGNIAKSANCPVSKGSNPIQ